MSGKYGGGRFQFDAIYMKAFDQRKISHYLTYGQVYKDFGLITPKQINSNILVVCPIHAECSEESQNLIESDLIYEHDGFCT
jgi:hypothetical protein